MMAWQPIETAPMDGTEVYAGASGYIGFPTFPVWMRYLDGAWCAYFGPDDWQKISPQPTHWRDNMPRAMASSSGRKGGEGG